MDYAIYVRVSTDHDEQISSIENQIDICTFWLERHGYAFNEQNVYKDEGITGTILLQRPAIQLLIDKAKKKQIGMVLFKSIHRLSRSLKDALELKELFAAHNVRIISVEESYDSFKVSKNDMSFEMNSMFADQYARTVSANVSSAMAAKVRRGEPIGKVPYGYKRDENKKMMIDEEKAKIVRYIYQLYNSGLGYIATAKRLNDEGIPAPKTEIWGYTTIHRIIKNPVYKGEYIAHKYGKVKINGKYKNIINPAESWKVYKNFHENIVDEQIWNEANPIRTVEKRVKISSHNEFRGISFCSECGSAMIIHVCGIRMNKKTNHRKHWAYLRCSRFRRYKEHGCVKHRPINYSDFRDFIMEQLRLEIENDVDLVGTTTENVKKKKEELQKALQQLHKKSDSLLDIYLDERISKHEFIEKKDDLEGRIQELETRINSLNRENEVAGQFVNFSDAIKNVDEKQTDLNDVFRVLINRIDVHPDGKIDIKYAFSRDD